MDREKIIALLKTKYASWLQLRQQAELVMAQIQGVAECADMKAAEVNEALGVSFFLDIEEKPKQ